MYKAKLQFGISRTLKEVQVDRSLVVVARPSARQRRSIATEAAAPTLDGVGALSRCQQAHPARAYPRACAAQAGRYGAGQLTVCRP
jgi:hypothetical protein